MAELGLWFFAKHRSRQRRPQASTSVGVRHQGLSEGGGVGTALDRDYVMAVRAAPKQIELYANASGRFPASTGQLLLALTGRATPRVDGEFASADGLEERTPQKD